MTSNPVIYSVGYEGRSIASFADLLTDLGVRVLVDVRLTPISRKRGFSKTMLQTVLQVRNIKYVHEKELGNPKDNREPFRRGDAEGLATFSRILVDTGDAALSRIAQLAQTEPVAVLCVEREAGACHRSLITDAVASRADVRVVAVP